MGHSNPATEKNLKLFGKGVVELGGAAQLFLAGDLPCLSNGANDLRHLQRVEMGLVAPKAMTPRPKSQQRQHLVQGTLAARGARLNVTHRP